MANVEALWSVSFKSGFGFAGTGVVVFETGRAFGGDSGWYYLGSYEVKEGKIRGRFLIQHYGAEIPTVFGHFPGNSFEIDMVGEFENDNTIKAVGTVVELPEANIELVFGRLSDLP